jgi:murein DD-endopeptidase MepM/ murein hydrolase activator NlpD
MGFKKLNVVVVPEGLNRVKQFRVPCVVLVLVSISLLALATYMTWVFRDYKEVKAQMPSIGQLQKENELHKRQLLHLAERVDQMTQKLAELKDLDHKLRIMVNLETGENDEQFQGVGGSDPSGMRTDHSKANTHQNLIQLMHRSLDNLSDEIALRRQDKTELHQFLENQRSILASTPSIWPTKGWLSSRFGQRVSPFTGQKEFHRGIDISTRMNAPIVAPADGIVSSFDSDRGYGKLLTLKHGYGLVTRFAHLNKALVRQGQYVKRGETIALVGKSGRTTGPHLHYEVHLNGVAVDPLRYILN